MNINNNINNFLQNLPEGVELIAVSKTQPVEKLQEAYNAGQRSFGENKVQEIVPKHEALPKDIHWHMIGHLQTNKVKYIAPFVYMIHSVDSKKLLEEIDKQAKRYLRVITCLLQVHIAEEESKFGFDSSEILELFSSSNFSELQNIKIDGLMGMATFTSDREQIRKEFRSLKTLFEKLKDIQLPGQVSMKNLSMGMSGDYKIAIEEGSTMIRVGSAIFGERNFKNE